MARIHVIHENQEWSAPLFDALRARNLPFADWDLTSGRIDLAAAPPDGVFYSRMSASSHSRGHRYSPEFTAALLAWLEAHDARVLNGSRALALEVSKVAQYAALERHGIRTPRTVATLGRDDLLAVASDFPTPFITKHNRAGKGLGVRLFENAHDLAVWVDGEDYEPPVDGIMLLQAYVDSPGQHITRVEFIGRQLLYAVRVDASAGFELCPADACEVGEASCPAGATGAEKFEIVAGFDHPLVAAYRHFMDSHDIDVAAFEFIEDARGTAFTYDINTNTNYNPGAEARAGISGMGRLADVLGGELERVRRRAAGAAVLQVA